MQNHPTLQLRSIGESWSIRKGGGYRGGMRRGLVGLEKTVHAPAKRGRGWRTAEARYS